MNTQAKAIAWWDVFDRDTLLHLRIPFCFYLMPIFLCGISQSPVIHLRSMAIFFVALHLFIYSGSNVYNSFMDKDEGSIGGLKTPPPVTPRLYYASIWADACGLLLGFVIGWQMALLLAGYMAFSKAYSWTGIRLKKYGYLGWASVMFFQGGYTFLMAGMAAQGHISASWFTPANLECMLFASLIIGGYYPLTQVYQHDEDASRGDLTISYHLGIRGTFLFALVLFGAGGAVALHYFSHYYSLVHCAVFLVSIAPVLGFFGYWMAKAWRNSHLADYDHAMLMTRLSAICMLICFTIMLVWNHPVVL